MQVYASAQIFIVNLHGLEIIYCEHFLFFYNPLEIYMPNTLSLQSVKFSVHPEPNKQTTHVLISAAVTAPQIVAEQPPKKVILLLDTSGSMNEPCGVNGTRMDKLKLAAKAFLDKLGPNDEYSALNFRDTASCFLSKRIASQNDTHVSDAIGKLWASGGTSFQKAIECAVKEIEEKYNNDLDNLMLVLVSDGQVCDAPDEKNPEKLVQILRDKVKDRRIPIMCAGIGNDYDQPFIVAVSNASGVTVVIHIRDDSDPTKAFDEILPCLNLRTKKEVIVTVNGGGKVNTENLGIILCNQTYTALFEYELPKGTELNTVNVQCTASTGDEVIKVTANTNNDIGFDAEILARYYIRKIAAIGLSTDSEDDKKRGLEFLLNQLSNVPSPQLQNDPKIIQVRNDLNAAISSRRDRNVGATLASTASALTASSQPLRTGSAAPNYSAPGDGSVAQKANADIYYVPLDDSIPALSPAGVTKKATRAALPPLSPAAASAKTSAISVSRPAYASPLTATAPEPASSAGYSIGASAPPPRAVGPAKPAAAKRAPGIVPQAAASPSSPVIQPAKPVSVPPPQVLPQPPQKPEASTKTRIPRVENNTGLPNATASDTTNQEHRTIGLPTQSVIHGGVAGVLQNPAMTIREGVERSRPAPVPARPVLPAPELVHHFPNIASSRVPLPAVLKNTGTPDNSSGTSTPASSSGIGSSQAATTVAADAPSALSPVPNNQTALRQAPSLVEASRPPRPVIAAFFKPAAAATASDPVASVTQSSEPGLSPASVAKPAASDGGFQPPKAAEARSPTHR